MTLLTLADYEDTAARRPWPAGVWDFIAGGAGRERTLAGNREAFGRWRLRPSVCVDVSRVDLSTKLLGTPWSFPAGIAPTALHELCSPDGERGTAVAAQAVGVPMVVSVMSSTTIEDIAAAAPQATLWQQIYVFRDRRVTASLVERAEAAGAHAIVVTVDSPWLGRRLRDLRNDFQMPADIQARNVAASLGSNPDISSPAAHSAQAMDPSLTWDCIEWLTELTSLPIVVKGVQRSDDAVHARNAGAAGVIVSNHGGRQLDRARPSLESLPEVAAAVPPDFPVLLDGGVRSGIDILIALASGASAVLIGRPVLHGLAVAGTRGAAAVLSILRTELNDAMGQAGQPGIATLDKTLITPYQPLRAAEPGW